MPPELFDVLPSALPFRIPPHWVALTGESPGSYSNKENAIKQIEEEINKTIGKASAALVGSLPLEASGELLTLGASSEMDGLCLLPHTSV